MTEKEDEKMKKKIQSNCECCEFYEYDEECDAYVCIQNLDVDELARFVSGDSGNCPYFRFYDEYKFVQKQN